MKCVPAHLKQNELELNGGVDGFHCVGADAAFLQNADERVKPATMRGTQRYYVEESTALTAPRAWRPGDTPCVASLVLPDIASTHTHTRSPSDPTAHHKLGFAKFRIPIRSADRR